MTRPWSTKRITSTKAREREAPVRPGIPVAVQKRRQRAAEIVSTGRPEEVRMVDLPTGGRKTTGVIFGVTGKQGGISGNPATSFAWSLRRRMAPIRVAPTTVQDASGTVVAVIEIDPVTGKRTRRSV